MPIRNLVFQRTAGETIILNDTITITVLATHANSVKLAITAPEDVRIWRGEIYTTPGQAMPPKEVPVVPAQILILVDEMFPQYQVCLAGPETEMIQELYAGTNYAAALSMAQTHSAALGVPIVDETGDAEDRAGIEADWREEAPADDNP